MAAAMQSSRSGRIRSGLGKSFCDRGGWQAAECMHHFALQSCYTGLDRVG